MISFPLLEPSLPIWRALTFEIEKSAVSEAEKNLIKRDRESTG